MTEELLKHRNLIIYPVVILLLVALAYIVGSHRHPGQFNELEIRIHALEMNDLRTLNQMKEFHRVTLDKLKEFQTNAGHHTHPGQ